MATLGLERIAPSARKGHGNVASATRLGRHVARQLTALRMSMTAAAAYEQADSPAARRAVLDRYSAQLGN
jgi:hypothetical protein